MTDSKSALEKVISGSEEEKQEKPEKSKKGNVGDVLGKTLKTVSLVYDNVEGYFLQ